MNQGELQGYEIECPRHGARFDVRTDNVMALPAEEPINTFKVRIQSDDVEIEV